MSYTRTTWIARVGTALNRFLKTNETSTEVELTNDPTGVTTAGTPFTVANMNKIEQGIYDAHVTADANATNLANNVNQGVKTTDSPTFVEVKAKVNGARFNVSAKTVTTTSGTDKIESEWYSDIIIYLSGISGTNILCNGWITNGTNVWILSAIENWGTTSIKFYGVDITSAVPPTKDQGIILYSTNDTNTWTGRISI